MNSDNQTKKELKATKTISTLITLAAICMLINSITILTLVLVLDKTLTATFSPPVILKTFPEFVPLIISNALGTLILMVTSNKVKKDTKESAWLTLIILITTTIGIRAINMIYISQLPKSFEAQGGNLKFDNLILLFSIIAAIILIIKKNKFPDSKPTSKQQKIVLKIFGLLSLSLISITTFKYYKALNPDYKYQEAQEKTDYHVYAPTYLPEGIKYESIFYTPEKGLLNKSNSTRLTLGIGLEKTLNSVNKENNFKIIILNQVGVESSFNLKGFGETLFGNNSSIKEISLPEAKENEAYLIRDTREKIQSKNLIFITKDNVLIQLTSGGSEVKEEDLISIAKGLE